MLSIAEALEKFNHLTEALREAVDRFLEPFTLVLPDRRTVPIRVSLAWFHFCLPDGTWSGWAVVARTEVLSREAPPEEMGLPPLYLVLVTNRPIRGQKDAQCLYSEWAQRGQIELFYRFLREGRKVVQSLCAAICGSRESILGRSRRPGSIPASIATNPPH